MRKLLLLILILSACGHFSVQAKKKFITVAVIDTGIHKSIKGHKKGICHYGHKDFTGTGLNDTHGHGTNVSGLIHKYAKGRRYCQVILKFFDPHATGKQNISRITAAIRHAINIKVDFINISGGGIGYTEMEQKMVKRALDRGIIIVAAAGNAKCNLDDKDCEYYPAMHDKRIVVVGNGTTKKRFPSSNYGSIVDLWVDGDNKKGEYGRAMTGTSQSTAIHTGKLVKKYVQEW